jgi:Tfp pilus assembly protein PilO
VLASPTAKWSAGTVLACVVLLAATWFGLIAPRRGEAADLRDQQVSAQQANNLLQAKIQQLRAQFADLPKTQAEVAAIHQQLTPVADVPNLVRRISALSTGAGTELMSIMPQAASTLAGPAVVPGAGAGSPAPGAVTGQGAAPAAGSGAGPAAGPGAGPAAGPGGAGGPAARTAGSGVVSIPLSISVGGDYYQVVGFVRKLQIEMTRAVLITSLQIDQDSTFGAAGVKLTLVGDVFALPGASTTTGSR